MGSAMNTVPPSRSTLTEIVLSTVTEPEGLEVSHRPVPAPGTGEALVEVLATGISFAEQAMLRGRYPGQPKFPFVPGYDLVGQVIAVGPGVGPSLVGRRVAAATKTGGWTTHAVFDARILVPVPDALDPADIETVVVNGITAWQMLHRKSRARPGQTILVHGASGGVGTTLVQLAHHAGIRVIGTAASRHHDALRALGAEPVDYHDPDLSGTVRRLVPGGVNAVFDHLGGPSFRRSFELLAPGGTLVAYGTGAGAQLNDTNNQVLAFIAMYGRLTLWAFTTNRHALFYNFWAGKHIRPNRFRKNLSADLTQVVALLSESKIAAQIAARFRLVDAADAMRFAKAQSVRGKIVLETMSSRRLRTISGSFETPTFARPVVQVHIPCISESHRDRAAAAGAGSRDLSRRRRLLAPARYRS
jgi:NADPH:quinone reductase-like Zn-dependent oxidoreductase